MAAAADTKKRKERIDRLRPFLKDNSLDKIPNKDKASLVHFLQDFKDEGNALFKEGQVEKASDHYRMALLVTTVLEDLYYHDVEKEFLTTLYTNAALCHLKMNKYQAALEDSEKALKIQPGNTKARYRKTQALEGLKRYKEALEEANKGVKVNPDVFKPLVSKLEEVLRSGPKAATASAAAAYLDPATDTSNEWLAETNALKTEKQREAVLRKQKMPRNKKKKVKNPQPVAAAAAAAADDSSDSDRDSDSSDYSLEAEPDTSSKNSNQKKPNTNTNTNSKPAGKAKTNVVTVKPSEPDPNTDVLLQRTGFTQVGASPKKKQPNGMGLDTFGMGDFADSSGKEASGVNEPAFIPVKTSKNKAQSTSTQKLPPVNIEWPLEEGFAFRRACKLCFVKTGEGYKGYKYMSSFQHKCEKNVLIIRRKDNASLNWIKIRPFPALHNSNFNEFKMCQQFMNGEPCKIGEPRCTFPHNKQEMHLWYKEFDEEFFFCDFMDELEKNKIDTSEELAARRPAEKTQKHIPGLNFKTGAKQRLASPAPLEDTSSSKAPLQQTASSKAPQQQPQASSAAKRTLLPTATPTSSAAPGAYVPSTSSAQNHSAKSSLLGHPHSNGQTSRPPQTSPPATLFPENTLNNYDYKIVCPLCFLFEDFPGRYRYAPCTHECEENVLAVKPKSAPNMQWMRVRERTNHRDFNGKYVICHSVINSDAKLCRFGEASCSFAHNEAEQYVWGLEKMGKFSITDFILQNRKASSARAFTVVELLKKHGGFFTLICRACLYGRPPAIREAAPNNTCSGVMRHRWDMYSILAHVDMATGAFTPIEARKITNKNAFFRICKYLAYCPNLANGQCVSAHSIVERDVWMLERDTDIPRIQIVQLSQSSGRYPPQPEPQRPQASSGGGRSSQPSLAQKVPSPSPPLQSSKDAGGSKPKVPYTVRAFCGLCWSNGTRSLEDGTTNRCVKGHNNFNLKRVFLILGIYRELRNLPAVIPRNLNFVVCRFIQQKKKCGFVGQGPCQFAHSEEERVLWIWMARNKVTKLEDVVKQCLEDAKTAKINQGDSVVSTSVVRVPSAAAHSKVRMPSDLQNNALYCRYCSTQTNSERQWEEHCASEKHNFNVNSDRDRQWNYRQPPWGKDTFFTICEKHMNGNRCQYSHMADMFNMCVYAHSQEELDEWKERSDWRQMKRLMAREHNMFSYMEKLLERYNAADSGVTEISETLPSGVEVECNQSLVEFRQDKNTALNWTFTVHSQMKLEKAALLHHNTRLHFRILMGDGSRHQIIPGDQVAQVTNPLSGKHSYEINVNFTGGMFGSYSQWLVFDFGKKPVLLRKLNVELGLKSDHDKVKDLRQKLSFDKWTGENRQVIPYQYTYDEFTLSLQQRYKEPYMEVAITQDSVRELNQHNYVHKMHRLLDLEEITRHKLISSFNMVTTAKVKQEIVNDQQNIYHCRHGELFLYLPLTDNLTEDTGAGKLILSSVRNLLLTRNDFTDKHRVYEALIETKGRDYVCVSVSPVCVRELQLTAGMVVELEVQFQINRMHFINMHYALDSLDNTDIVFPDITKINPAFNEQHSLKVSSRHLNQDQLQAVKHIVAERTGYTPPFIMYGPFGTGKTETLAQAAMVLLRERHDCRILICAQSNSAADLYITKHLDPFLRRSPAAGNALLLRIVSKDRRVTSIPEESRKYCYYSQDGNSFELPSADFIKQVRVVVTTVEMSLRLKSMQLKGSFTHIFIDEAAQALETETIMPLTLATDKTCVVLTGDHLQISPKVFSAEARRQNFGMSMLERLFEYYSNYTHQLAEASLSNPLNIFLSINYRTKREILRFLSAVFYGGPEKLTAGVNVKSVVEVTPMQFYAVLGREEQLPNSPSYVNMAECSELVERVITLLNEWPCEWGKVAPEEISVITPYYDQVKKLRSMFKGHHRADLRLVNVEPVQNIQGKEFRALFISTVRTRHLLQSKHIAKALAEAELVGGVTDFAFLSDPKLLNTALTRTKSMVAVVGDPMALCAIGDCIQIWRTFMKHCSNMNSIRPSHMNYDNIRGQVIELQMSPVGRKLKEVTEMCKKPPPPTSPPPVDSGPGDKFNRQTSVPGEVFVDDVDPHYGAGDAASSYSSPPLSVPAANSAFSSPALSETSSVYSLLGLPEPSANPAFSASQAAVPVNGLNLAYSAQLPSQAAVPGEPAYTALPPSLTPSSMYSMLPPVMPSANPLTPAFTAPPPDFSRPPPVHAPPPIMNAASAPPPPLKLPSVKPAPLKPAPLKPLGKLKLGRPLMVEEFKTSDFPVKADELMLQLAMEGGAQGVTLPLKVECVQVELSQGHALLTYNAAMANDDRRRKLLQAAAAGLEFESDAEIYRNFDEDSAMVTKYYNYTEQTLHAALHNNPELYKKCIVSIKQDGASVARLIDPSNAVWEIELEGMLDRGRALDQDEVVVKVLPPVADKPGVQGQVVGVIQRAVDHRLRTFVCSADPSDTGLLSPVTPGCPAIYNIILHKHLEQVKAGCVCVYRLGADNSLSFSHYENVESGNGDSKLFVVRYLKWLPGFYNPIGVVVGVVPMGNTLTSALKIVDVEHNVPVEFSGAVEEEVRCKHSCSDVPAEEFSRRQDLRHAWAFSIAGAQDKEVQVAFSIDQVSETSYCVGVHITDVASFVSAGSSVDSEAFQRGMSLLPLGRDPVPMLPPRLSTDLYSLVPNKDRCALSVFMTVVGNGEEWDVMDTAIRPTVINSKKCFTYHDVDSILGDLEGAEQEYLPSCVLVLFQISQMQHRLRLGNAYLDPQQGPVERMAPRGHQMVRELLIMTNQQVAKQLLRVFPSCTPLLHQAAPARTQLELWKEQHAADAINSVSITKPFLDTNKVCTCRMVCMCVFSYMRTRSVEPREHFHVANSVWRELVEAASQENMAALHKVVTASLTFPQTVVALQDLHNITPAQRWICSGDVDPLNQGHYSLNVGCMTEATSPLRSYVSLVVQRLMWAVAQDQPCPYSQPDMARMANTCNTASHRATSFANADQRVRLAAALQARPLTLLPVVEKVDEKKMLLHFPGLESIPEDERTVSLAVFSPSAVPAADAQKPEKVWVSMERRIYNTDRGQSGVMWSSGAELCGDRHVKFLPPFQWQQLLAAMREENEEKQMASVANVQLHMQEPLNDSHYSADVSCEMGSGSVQQFTEFSLALKPCMTLQVQLTAGLTPQGLLTPQIQLLTLTPTLDLCLEHARNPGACFAKTAACSRLLKAYRDEVHYQQLMMPVLAVEAAESAVCSQESILIHNVGITWTDQSMGSYTGDNGGVVIGQFSLSHTFCRERGIFCRSQTHKELEGFGLHCSEQAPMDLVCVRYRGVEMGQVAKLEEREQALLKAGGASSWVGHCMVMQTSSDGQDTLTVSLQLLSSSVRIPPQLLQSSTAARLCTVEIIPKSPLFRQMEYSVASLTSASRLARDVAVGRTPINNIDQSDVGLLMSQLDMGQLNGQQQEAVQVALRQPFTVVSGPPGSGKTWVALQLTLLFVQRNRMAAQPPAVTNNRAQVLVCAGSEAALDNFAEHLRNMGAGCPAVVRVYGEHVERQLHPVPRGTLAPSKLKAGGNGSKVLKQVMGLHELIRSPGSRYQDSLLEYDKIFTMYADSLNYQQVESYEALVLEAEVEELRNAEIILTTCSCAASARMAAGTNVKQIIVDSSESCMEVENLLPAILMRSAQQLVVLGDPHQLTPSVRSDSARTMGLGMSLLDRYSDTAISLSCHYRLTHAVRDVCLESFYGGQLVAGEAGEGTTARPLVMSHVEGQEQSCMVSTAAGVLQSFSNDREAKAVAGVIEDMVKKGVASYRLVVLTQYAGQLQLIKHYLALRHLANVPVHTVLDSQGLEFDFVVLSTCRSVSRSEMQKAPTSDWIQTRFGVTADPHQMSVAFTRAREVLIITGNKFLLQCHPQWKKVLDQCRRHKCLVDAKAFE